ncbi:MAG: hypothetical protein ACOYEV_01565 [Candidatus Nanopelagicales bacterium]
MGTGRARARGARRALVVGLAVGALVLLGGCGVPLQDVAQPLPVGATSPPPQVITMPNGRSQPIYFVAGRGLEPVREMLFDRTANGIMTALAAGPGSDHPDLRTLLLDPLTGVPMLAVSSIGTDGLVTLQAGDAFTQLQATDQVLLLGQVALSLADLGLPKIAVVDSSGATLALPLPDGRVTIDAADAEAYRSLVSSAAQE